MGISATLILGTVVTGTEVALGAMALGSTAASIYSTKQAGEAAKEQAQAQQRRAEIQNVRNVRQQIREARLAEASMTNVAAQTGGMGGSGLAGGLGSVGSQLSGNLSYMADVAEQNTAISNAAISGAQAQSDAAMWGSIGKLSGTIFSGTTGVSPAGAIGRALGKGK
jgi:hypothetical protein